MAERFTEEEQAITALVDYSGCTSTRAEQLVEAVRDVAVSSSLGLISGSEPVASSIVDQRVARLDALHQQAGKLDADEIAGVFRITISQARALTRTYEARFPKQAEAGLKERLTKLVAKPARDDENNLIGTITFSDRELLGYAVKCLRRLGIEQGVKVQPNLKLTIWLDATDKDGASVKPLEKLGIKLGQ